MAQKSASVSAIPNLITPSISGRMFYADDEIPPHGFTTRDLLKEISELRRENFNLKLRVFVKIENNSRTASARESRNNDIIRELEYAKKTIEVLTKEIEEKNNLLLEAKVAIEQQEDKFKVLVIRTESEIEEQEQYINHLETKIEEEAASNSTATTTMKTMHLSIMKQNEELGDAYAKIQAMEEELANNKISLEMYEQKTNELSQKNQELKKLSEERLRLNIFATQAIRNQRIEVENNNKKIDEIKKQIVKSTEEILAMNQKYKL